MSAKHSLNGLAFLPDIDNATQTDQVYYDSATGELTYGSIPVVATPTLDEVTTAGNTTTNSIAVNKIFANGSTNASVRVHTPGSGTAQFFLKSEVTDSYIKQFIMEGRFKISTQYFGSGATYFQDNSGNTSLTLFTNSTNNVGINTTTDAGYKLDVNGTARVVNDAIINGLTVGLGGGSLSTNMAVGYDALSANSGGQYNTAVGRNALYQNTSGLQNTAIGNFVLGNNLSGDYNVAVGGEALRLNTASNNTAVGYKAGYSNTTGTRNTALGYEALLSNTTNSGSTAIGYQAAKNSNTRETTAIGDRAATNTTTGRSNTAVGMYSMLSNTTGARNTAIGKNSLALNVSGSENTAVGDGALEANLASNNTAVGRWAAYFNTTGTGNVFLGYRAGYSNTTQSNKLYIANNDTSSLIYGDFSTGNVMIGTTTDAGYKLDVNGTARIGNSSYYLTLANGGAAGGILRVGGANYGHAELKSTGLTLNGGHTIAGTGGTQRFIITSNIAPLSADDDDYDGAMVFSANNPGAQSHNSWSGYSNAKAFNFIKKNFDGTYTSLMALHGNNNVGVGVVNPSYKLDVNGTARAVKSKIDFTPTSDTIALDIRGTGTPNDYFTLSNATGGANDVFLPIFFYKAATYGYNGGTNRYTSGVYGGGFIAAVDDSSFPSAAGAGAAMHFNSRAYANNGPLSNRYLFSWGSWLTTHMAMTAGGNLLIGTTIDSGYKLGVNGDASVSGDINADGDFYQNGTQGYTGTVTIQQPSPLPPINIDIQGGIITNVT